MTLSVFLSHSVGEAENRMVDELSARLTGAQVPHYVAKYDRQPGVYLSEKVRGHIEASPVLFALITRRGQDSRYVNQEIGYALRGKSRVIAFVEDGAWEGAMIAGVEQVPFSSDAPSKDIAAVTEFVARLKAEADLRDAHAKIGRLEAEVSAAETVAVIMVGVAIILLVVLLASKE